MAVTFPATAAFIAGDSAATAGVTASVADSALATAGTVAATTAAGAAVSSMNTPKTPTAPQTPATPPGATPATLATTPGGATSTNKGAAAALAQQSIGTSQQGILSPTPTDKAKLLGGGS